MGDQPCCTAGFGPDGGPKKSPTPGSWAACSRAAARSACDRIVVCSAPSGSSSPRACHLVCAVGCVASAAVGVPCAYGGCWWRGGAAACWPGAADGGCAPAVGGCGAEGGCGACLTVAAVPTVAVRPAGDAVTPRHSALARLGVWERPGLVAAAREAVLRPRVGRRRCGVAALLLRLLVGARIVVRGEEIRWCAHRCFRFRFGSMVRCRSSRWETKCPRAIGQ